MAKLQRFAFALALVGIAHSARAQIHSEGYIDTNFLASCFGSTSPRALLVQFDGKIIAGGSFTAPTFACVNAIDRMSANGVPDNTFQSPFQAGDAVNAMTFQGNKIVVAGYMTVSGNPVSLARLNANGSLDNTFPIAIHNTAVVFNTLLTQADGKIIAAGDASNGGQFGYIVRLNASGTVDTNFVNGAATPLQSFFPVISALAPASEGKTLVGGSFSTYRGSARPGLARLNTDGTLDSMYSPEISDGAIIRALLSLPGGKVLVAGNFTVDGVANRALTRLNSDGTVDGTFQTLNGGGTTGLSLVLQPDGKILFGHSFGVMRLNTNGAPDTTFGPRNAFQQLGTDATDATALALTASSNLIVGASRVLVDTTERRGVTRLFGFLPPLPPPPVIVTQPLTQFVKSGTNVTFSVVATGAPPIKFQWRKNGANIKGATNTFLAFTNVNSTHTANYTVVASNPGGSVTSVVARLSVSFETDTLRVITNGAGAVTPDLTRQPLEIGRTFTITAKPVVGNLFSNWTGGVTSSTPTLSFEMRSNLTIVVNFVPSPFTPVKGAYSGLFFNPDAPAHENAGAIMLTLDDKGGIRGSVRTGTRVRKVSGAFSLDRITTITLPATASDPALVLALELDVANEVIVGSAIKGTNALPLWAYRNPFSSKSNPLSTAGNYNAALPGTNDSSAQTFGDGFATLTLSTAGRVSGKASLADGMMIKVQSASSRNAHVPIYVPLYGGRGSIFGWLTVTNSEMNDVAGSLMWFKPGTVGGAFYPEGVSNRIEVIGSRYTAIPAGTPVLTLANGLVAITSGNPTDGFTNSITLGGDNKITGDNELSLTISPAKGSVSGSFREPSTNLRRTIKGVALPKQNQARGFYPGTGRSGGVFVGDAP